jgi:hypothetical protein
MITDLQPLRGQGSGQSRPFQQPTQQLQRAAQVVMSSASIAIGDSRSTALVISNAQGRTESEIGIPLDSRQRDRIQDWIPPPIVEEDLRLMSSSPNDVETVLSKVRSQTALAPTTAPYSEVEDSFELEISQRLFAQGQKHYQLKEHVSARQCLTQVIAKVKLLSLKSLRKLGVWWRQAPISTSVSGDE